MAQDVCFDDAQIAQMVKDVALLVKEGGEEIPDALLDGNGAAETPEFQVFRYVAATALFTAAALRMTRPAAPEKMMEWVRGVFEGGGLIDALAYSDSFAGIGAFLDKALMLSLAEEGVAPVSPDTVLAVQEVLWELGL